MTGPLPGAKYRLLHGDSLAVLRTLPDECVHCCVTSPPLFGPGIGGEEAPEARVARLVAVFAEARRVLRPEGALWLDLVEAGPPWGPGMPGGRLGGIPWRLALALRADSWILRSELSACKLARMPESAGNRPARLVESCILAGSRKGDVILDPFAGTGAVGEVALAMGRRFLGIDPSEARCEIARARLEALPARAGRKKAAAPKEGQLAFSLNGGEPE